MRVASRHIQRPIFKISIFNTVRIRNYRVVIGVLPKAGEKLPRCGRSSGPRLTSEMIRNSPNVRAFGDWWLGAGSLSQHGPRSVPLFIVAGGLQVVCVQLLYIHECLMLGRKGMCACGLV